MVISFAPGYIFHINILTLKNNLSTVVHVVPPVTFDYLLAFDTSFFLSLISVSQIWCEVSHTYVVSIYSFVPDKTEEACLCLMWYP